MRIIGVFSPEVAARRKAMLKEIRGTSIRRSLNRRGYKKAAQGIPVLENEGDDVCALRGHAPAWVQRATYAPNAGWSRSVSHREGRVDFVPDWRKRV